MNTLSVIQRLYTTCRNAGIWDRLVLETENGKETVTFSSTVSRPSNLPEETCWKDGGRRKKPSKIKKDCLRREPCLERMRTVQERADAEKPGDFTSAPGAPGNKPIVPGHPGTFDLFRDTLEPAILFLDTLEPATRFPDTLEPATLFPDTLEPVTPFPDPLESETPFPDTLKSEPPLLVPLLPW